MQDNLTIARPYAQAVFETARDAGAIAEWNDALTLLSLAVSDTAMRRLIVDPGVSRERVLAVLFAVLGNAQPEKFGNFVKVLAEARRLQIAPEIASRYAVLRAAQENVAQVEVTTAFPLSGELEQRIGQAMRARLGKETRVTQTVDPQLIGGARVKVGDMVYDASLRGGLGQLANVFNLK